MKIILKNAILISERKELNEMNMKIRLGIIGAGWMSSMCCDAIAVTNNVEAYGVYARSLPKAKDFAEKYLIPFCTDDVNALLQNKNIDAIYIATTNESHAQFAMMAINAGKSVLLEKPFTLNHAQAKELQEAAKAKGCFVMEAMWSRFSPAMLSIAYLVKTEAIGHLRSIKIQTGCVLTKEKNARVYDKQLGGGALLDIGVYPLSIIQMITGIHPVKVTNNMNTDNSTGVDVENTITLIYENGLKAEVYVTCFKDLASTLVIEGSNGSIACENYVFAQSFTLENDNDSKYYNFTTAREPYTYQLEHFAHCIKQGKKDSYIMPLSSTLQVMKLLDEIRQVAGYYYPQEISI